MKLESKHYKIIGSAVAIVMLLLGMLLSEMNIIGKDGIDVVVEVHSRFELTLKPDMTVKSSILYNEEGGMVTKKLNLSSREMKEAVGILANIMIENNMIQENNKTIMVSVISHEKEIDSQDVSSEVVDTLKEVFEHSFSTGKLDYEVSIFSTTADDTDKRLKQISKEYKVSLPKAKLMQRYHRALGSHTMGQLAKMPIEQMYLDLTKNEVDIK